MGIEEKTLKDIIFEVYAAGFEAGMAQNVDIKTSYNNYYNNVIQPIISASGLVK